MKNKNCCIATRQNIKLDLIKLAKWSPYNCYLACKILLDNEFSIDIFADFLRYCFKYGYRKTFKLVFSEIVQGLLNQDLVVTCKADYLHIRYNTIEVILDQIFLPFDEQIDAKQSTRSAIVCDTINILEPLFLIEKECLTDNILLNQMFGQNYVVKIKSFSMWVASFPFTKKALKKLNRLEQDWNILNEYGKNALWYACKYGSTEMVEYLWGRTDDKHVQGVEIYFESHNLIEVALYFNPRPKVTEFLLMHKSDLPVCVPKNLFSSIPLFMPKCNNRLKVIKTICRKVNYFELEFGENLFDTLLSNFYDLSIRESEYILNQMHIRNNKFHLSLLVCLTYLIFTKLVVFLIY